MFTAMLGAIVRYNDFQIHRIIIFFLRTEFSRRKNSNKADRELEPSKQNAIESENRSKNVERNARNIRRIRIVYPVRISTHLASLAGVYSIVKTGCLVPADATQYRGPVEFCKRNRRKKKKITHCRFTCTRCVSV